MISWIKRNFALERSEFIIYLQTLLINIALSMIYPFQPLLATSKGISTIIIGFIFCVESAFALLNTFIFGKLMGKMNKKNLLCAGLILQLLSIIGFGSLNLIKNSTLFIVLSLILGFISSFNALVFVVLYSILPILYPKSLEQKIENMEGLCTFGFIIGPLFGAPFYKIGGQSLPFYSIACLIAILIPLVVAYLDMTKVQEIEKLSEVLSDNLSARLSQKEEEEKDKKKKEKGIIAITFHPKVLLVLLFFILNQSASQNVSSYLSTFLFDAFDLEQDKINQIYMINSGFYFVAILFLKLCDVKKYNKTMILTASFVLSFALMLIGPEKYLTISRSPYTLVVALLLINFSQAFLIIPTIQFWNIFLKKIFKLSKEITSDQGAILLNTSFIGGEFIGPLVGGIFLDKQGFARSCSIFSMAAFISLIIVSIELLVEVILAKIAKTKRLLKKWKTMERRNTDVHRIDNEQEREREDVLHEKWRRLSWTIQDKMKTKPKEPIQTSEIIRTDSTAIDQRGLDFGRSKNEHIESNFDENIFNVRTETIASEQRALSVDWMRMPRFYFPVQNAEKLALLSMNLESSEDIKPT